MRKSLNIVMGLLDKLVVLFANIGAWILVIMSLLVTYEVVMRYVVECEHV